MSKRERPAAEQWTVRCMIEWGKRCDNCKRWRLRAQYHEFHGGGHWWRECLHCTIDTLSEGLTGARDLLEPLAKIALDEVCPLCRCGVGLHDNAECPLAHVGLDAALTQELGRSEATQ